VSIRVVIADDHRLFAEALKLFVERDRQVEVVGIAEDGAEAIDLALGEDADVVLMDLNMPVLDGLEATRRLHVLKPGVRVVIVSALEQLDISERARAAGAADWITKADVHMGVLEKIRTAGSGT
jgi:DNA-binding NarL/FixJ family response regulator